MISCETMMSVLQTIETIDFCCKRSAYSDAYTLIRKYRDDLMQYLFILNIIKNRHGLTDDEAKLFSLNPESMLEMIKLDFEILVSGDRKTEAELAMEKWVYNELGNTENIGDRKKYFDASKYKSYLISQDEKIGYIFNEFLLEKWKTEDRKLNNYVHTNGIKYLTDNYIYQEHKEDKDGELIKTMQNITDIFLSILALVDSSKLRSSDYLDALEMCSAPEQGSQYWVCPIIVEYMNDRFEKNFLITFKQMKAMECFS